MTVLGKGASREPIERFEYERFESPQVGLALTRLVGLLMRDVALTRDEVGLMARLLTSEAAPTGTTRLSDWLAENGDGLGRRYVSELRRNYRQSTNPGSYPQVEDPSEREHPYDSGAVGH